MQAITHKRTQDIFYENVVDISQSGEHVVIWVDNAGPRRELAQQEHDDQIVKAIDHVCGEKCTYEIKLAKSNTTHERSAHVMRQTPRV